MARVTVERTLSKCENRFELVVLVSYRAHAIACCSSSLVDSGNKYAVSALREIEAGKIDIDELRNTVIQKYAIENKRSITNNSFMVSDFSLKNGKELNEDNSNNARIGKTKVVGTYLNSDEREVELDIGKDFFISDKNDAKKNDSVESK